MNYDWGDGSPGSRIRADGFSARWTRCLDLTPGSYRFTSMSDDGMRVWLDGELIVNWRGEYFRSTTLSHLSTQHVSRFASLM